MKASTAKHPTTRPPDKSPAKPQARTGVRRQPDLTRQQLLQCAFDEIHRSGFRAASLDAILESSGVTKGALYHHFGSKTALGYAVVDEVVRPWVEALWKPILEAGNVIDAALTLCRELARARSEQALQYGCPFNNLINEMSPLDRGFRERLQHILRDWHEGVIVGIRRGQANGSVRKDIDAEQVSALIISIAEGSVGLAKAKQSPAFFDAAMRGLEAYLESLRPPRAHP